MKTHALKWLIVLAAVSGLRLHAQEPPVTGKQRQPQSARLPEGVRVERDIEYAQVGDKKLLLDLYLPETASEPLPIIVGIHGGGWANGSKAGGQGSWLAGHGYAVAVINYRLSGEAVFPAQIEDCKAAVRWLRANAEKYKLNADRIGATGHSAGGHLVSLLATSGDVKEFDKGQNLEYSSRIQAAAPMSGPSDLLQMDSHAPPGARLKHDAPNSPEARLIGGPIQENKDKAAKANPITYVTKDDPPFLIVHGDQDPVVPVHQAELLHNALKQAGVETKQHQVAGAGHGVGGREVNDQIAAFFDRHLKKELRSSGEPAKSQEGKAAAPGVRAENSPISSRDFNPRKVVPPRSPINNVPVLSADQVKDEVTENELVIGVVVGGQARAYPINMLTGPSREIINDVLGKKPIAATW